MKMNKVENLIWFVFSIFGAIFLVIGLSVCFNIFNTE